MYQSDIINLVLKNLNLMEEKVIEQQGESQAVQPAVSVQPAKKKRTCLFTCGIIVVVLLICSIVCGIATFAIFGATLNYAKNEVSGLLCSPNDSGVENVYNNNTTDSYKTRVSINDFKNEVGKLSGTPCDEINNVSIFNIRYFTQNNWKYSAVTNNGDITATFEGKVGGKNITLRTLRSTSNSSDNKIDSFAINGESESN